MTSRFAAVALLALAACDDGPDTAARPEPVPLTAEAVSHFCQMGILEHPGPKAQVHLAGHPQPLFFAQVRDAIAYLKSPESLGEVRAAYVPDMAAAESWEAPGRDHWIAAEDARFVVGSDRRGGMGVPEIVPFAREADARAFAACHGGAVMALDAIPAEAALGAVDFEIPAPPPGKGDGA